LNLFAVLLLAFSLYTEGLKPYVIEGPSMEPALHQQDRVFIDPAYYESHPVVRGDLIIFQATPTRSYVKRIIALPGERVKVEGDSVYVNGQRIEEPYLTEPVAAAARKGRLFNTRNFPETLVPDGTVFVMGDNRSNSADSRDIGFIELTKLEGRIVNVNGLPIQP
jgi:signal peptidase I